MMTLKLIRNISFIFLALSLVSQATAGTVNVINENKKNLKIRIKAEGDVISENLASYVQIIPGEYLYSFKVDAGNLKGKTLYSIKGDTNPFTMGDTCEHLSVYEDYRVTFINDTAGTTCVADKIK
ncbi:hypothetical protein [Candidatus Nucleicultrix amoebiphila]|uniref:Uncharacterized protein n=1 Tax=Candidatus Nucleicultrix amoebiphila FS5 TaxID=1414854 RepID=A0A1W6N5E8_9PROT|nr:hypothetical protein [Candidatus Nucleicultrix amoebiphila]ARN85077.1 hypothetical protein GQ61_06995 [Candidatus Nucleicultrix amoebiphila FS5]